MKKAIGITCLLAVFLFSFTSCSGTVKVSGNSSTSQTVEDGEILDASPEGPVSQPKAIKRVEPDYPEKARKENVDGSVFLEVIIDSEGNVQKVKVLKESSPHFEFGKEAVKAVRQWKFEPTVYNGKPVAVRVRFSVEFNLLV
jgi:TonB family protein